MDYSKFDYLAYCDASGDDGMKFNTDKSRGSSYAFTVATLLMKRTDLDYNEALFIEAKKLGGIRPDQEVKYSSLKRMSRGRQMMKHIAGLRARLFVGVALKTKLPLNDYLAKPETKALTTLTQVFPIAQCSKAVAAGQTLGIAIDQQKQIEQTLVSQLLNNIFQNERPEQIPPIEFLDSRQCLMIQCADWCAGAIREVFESYLRGELNVRGNQCAICSPQSPLCKWGRLHRIEPGLSPMIPLR